jgi:hypothetical protein
MSLLSSCAAWTIPSCTSDLATTYWTNRFARRLWRLMPYQFSQHGLSFGLHLSSCLSYYHTSTFPSHLWVVTDIWLVHFHLTI